MRISLKRFIHECVLSTTHRLAFHRGFFFIRFFFVGFGRLIGILVMVSFVILKSFRFAPSTAMPIGTPCPSVSRLRFAPCFARSVGFGPLFFPSKRRFCHRSIHRTKARAGRGGLARNSQAGISTLLRCTMDSIAARQVGSRYCRLRNRAGFSILHSLNRCSCICTTLQETIPLIRQT
jgi:hypothetical protein